MHPAGRRQQPPRPPRQPDAGSPDDVPEDMPEEYPPGEFSDEQSPDFPEPVDDSPAESPPDSL